MRVASFVLLLFVGSRAIAQSPCTSGEVMNDQAQIARTAIQNRIDEMIEADEAKDLPSKMHYFAPDFTLRLPDGTLQKRAQLESDLKRDMDWILTVSDQTTTKVECLQLRGTEATVWTRQHYVRTVPDRKDGSPHELITNVTHRETWIYSKDGWLTKHIDVLQEGPVFLDGKPYEN